MRYRNDIRLLLGEMYHCQDLVVDPRVFFHCIWDTKGLYLAGEGIYLLGVISVEVILDYTFHAMFQQSRLLLLN
jgi:hypothetical protein